MTHINTILPESFRLTKARRLIVHLIEQSKDHLGVEAIYERAKKLSSGIGIATVYRAVKFLEEGGVIHKCEFKNGQIGYVAKKESHDHHHHFVEIETGKIIEFEDETLEDMMEKIALKHGYDLMDHQVDFYVRKRKNKKSNQ